MRNVTQWVSERKTVLTTALEFKMLGYHRYLPSWLTNKLILGPLKKYVQSHRSNYENKNLEDHSIKYI